MKTEIIIGKHAHVTCKNESPPENWGISESSNQKNKASTNNTGFHKHSDVTQKWGNQGASTPQNVNMWQLRMLDVFNASLKVG